ncbi:hypothetical protein PUN28_008268 [Cardiocondyla obscurior]|uniref:MADF domain-containing protein n=1 Tax=Cardiocondyla obscurior TaxID=286306 RepID=A0AAW2G1Q4_9HYME
MEDIDTLETINDEVLIALVKENPVLYDKKHRNYKNQKVKKNTRWNQLRNQLGKKLREMKTKPANGSSAKKVEWHLMGPMSFFIPYISHRKKKINNSVNCSLEQSTSALSKLIKTVKSSISESIILKVDQQKTKNPFAETIFVAFDQVPAVQEIDCLIDILNMIKTYHNT